MTEYKLTQKKKMKLALRLIQYPPSENNFYFCYINLHKKPNSEAFFPISPQISLFYAQNRNKKNFLRKGAATKLSLCLMN
jgi:hypothetical protein